MTVHVHALRGCAPSPLAHYLKALGILRLVARQKDENARGLWKDDVFHLASSLDEEALVQYLCDEYEPTPMLAPWNGGSGFYPKDNKVGFDALVASTAPRFAAYRHAIERARRQVAHRSASPKDEEKNALLAACGREWGEEALEWFGAAVATRSDGTGRYPALLGTGGNDGRLDFTNNFMQRLTEACDMSTGRASESARRLLRQAIWGTADRGLLTGKPIGQFLPGGAGGANSTSGFDGDSLVNPWDFILMLEGAVVLRVSALRRLSGVELKQAAAPFALRGTTEGYASASAEDDSARGEQWMPIWSNAASFGEITELFAEGRLQCATDRAQSALEAARAIGRLGVARGVTSFVRYGFLERNGQANLAVPMATLRVTPRPNVRLLDEIDGWLTKFRLAAGQKTAPASWQRAVRRIEALALAVCDSESNPRGWQALLAELGQAEDLIARSAKESATARLSPVPQLSSGWLKAITNANETDVHVRVAIAVASQRAPRGCDLPTIRGHCLPLDLTASRPRFRVAADALAKDPGVVWVADDLVESLAAVSVRRVMEARGLGVHSFPLIGEAFAGLADVAHFIEGRLDERWTARLARGLMAVGSREFREAPRFEAQRGLALHALFRVAMLPERVGELEPRCDPEILRLLMAGRIEQATSLAVRRLRAMNLNPKLEIAAGDARTAMRLAASLAIPVSSTDLTRLVKLVSTPFPDAAAKESP